MDMLTENAATDLAARGALDRDDILGLIPHRPPFLFLDRVASLMAGYSGIGLLTVPEDCPYCAALHPGLKTLPGAILVEAMAQTSMVVAASAFAARERRATVALRTITGVKFRKPVHPGDEVRMHCVWDGRRGAMWRSRVTATVAGARVAEAAYAALLMAG